jgi:hypothetical protein
MFPFASPLILLYHSCPEHPWTPIPQEEGEQRDAGEGGEKTGSNPYPKKKGSSRRKKTNAGKRKEEHDIEMVEDGGESLVEGRRHNRASRNFFPGGRREGKNRKGRRGKGNLKARCTLPFSPLSLLPPLPLSPLRQDQGVPLKHHYKYFLEALSPFFFFGQGGGT